MRSTTSTRVAGIVAGLALSVGALGAPALASAGEPAGNEPAACAKEQSHLDKAEAALARLTAVFEHQQEKVKKAKKHAAQADTAQERNRARKALREAKAARDDAKETKRAQQQRVAKAQERLEACQAEQPPVDA